MIENECINCEYWNSLDSLTGVCPEMLATLRLESNTLARGSMEVRTRAHAGCDLFSASIDAQVERAAGIVEWSERCRGLAAARPEHLR